MLFCFGAFRFYEWNQSFYCCALTSTYILCGFFSHAINRCAFAFARWTTIRECMRTTTIATTHYYCKQANTHTLIQRMYVYIFMGVCVCSFHCIFCSLFATTSNCNLFAFHIDFDSEYGKRFLSTATFLYMCIYECVR